MLAPTTEKIQIGIEWISNLYPNFIFWLLKTNCWALKLMYLLDGYFVLFRIVGYIKKGFHTNYIQQYIRFTRLLQDKSDLIVDFKVHANHQKSKILDQGNYNRPKFTEKTPVFMCSRFVWFSAGNKLLPKHHTSNRLLPEVLLLYM